MRLGTSLVGWMIVYTHCIWLGTLLAIGCGADGDQLYRLLMGFSPFTIGFALLLRVSQKMPSVHQTMVWLTYPLLVLVPMAAYAVFPILVNVSINGGTICDHPAASWHVWWAPVQVATLVVIVVTTVRAWINARQAD